MANWQHLSAPPSKNESRVVIRFLMAIIIKMDYQCMATQDAIDRIVKDGFRGREDFISRFRKGDYTRQELCDAVMGHWKDTDIKLATGWSRDYWLGMIDGEALSENRISPKRVG